MQLRVWVCVCMRACLFQPKQSHTYYMEVKYDTEYHYINPNQAQNRTYQRKQ